MPFDSLAYIASYDDLVHAFGTNTAAGKQHYLAHGYDEGRSVTFDGLQYIATYGDLIYALGRLPRPVPNISSSTGWAKRGSAMGSTRCSMSPTTPICRWPLAPTMSRRPGISLPTDTMRSGPTNRWRPLRISWCELQHRTSVRRGRAGGGRSADQVRTAARRHGTPSRRWPWRDKIQQAWRDGCGRDGPCPALAGGASIRTTKVVLAAAHLDHNPAHCGRRHRNVKALCEHCHLLHGRPEHRRRIRLTLRRQRALGDLFLGPYSASWSSVERLTLTEHRPHMHLHSMMIFLSIN